jgi:hypothetical protein
MLSPTDDFAISSLLRHDNTAGSPAGLKHYVSPFKPDKHLRNAKS